MLPASAHETAAGTALLDGVAAQTDRVEKALVDQGLKKTVVDQGKRYGIDVGTVERNPADTGFVPRSKRWIIEQTNGILMFYRRLVRDYEYRPASSRSWVFRAMTSQSHRSSPRFPAVRLRSRRPPPVAEQASGVAASVSAARAQSVEAPGKATGWVEQRGQGVFALTRRALSRRAPHQGALVRTRPGRLTAKLRPGVPCGLPPRRKRPRSLERSRPYRGGAECAGRPRCRRSAPVPVLFSRPGTATLRRRPCPIERHRRVGQSRRASGRSARCGLSVTWSVTIAVRVCSSDTVTLAGRM